VVKGSEADVAQDDYYYEIQLTNKQLVFYFMAGATGLILSFLAGVMVGKGVDAGAGDVQAARPVVEERIVAEEPAVRPTAPPPAEDLTYAGRLESERPEEARLETKARPPGASSPKAAKASPPPPAAKASPPPKAAPRATPAAPTRLADASVAPPVAGKGAPAADPKPAPAVTKPVAKAPPPPTKAAPTEKGGSSSFTIQVGAFKDKTTADSVVSRLKTKGFAAYLVAPESEGAGLYNVRVGSYPARADAERVQAKLRDQEKFKPFIVKN
jgi:cell division protein FtsN